jgi:hypothetical protein
MRYILAFWRLRTFCDLNGLYMTLSIVDTRLEVLGSVPTGKIVTNQPLYLPIMHKRSPRPPRREKANGIRANAMVMSPSKLPAQPMLRPSNAIKCKISDAGLVEE